MNTTLPASTMDNKVTYSMTDDNAEVKSKAIYIACEVVNSILLLLSLYILVCMIAYGLKTRKWKSNGRKSDVNSGLVYTAAVVAVALTIPRYIAGQVIFNVLYIEGASIWCETIMDFGNACYFVALYPIYLFLWIRQKALYGHPAMRRLAGKCIAVFSWVTLVALSVAAVGVGLMFIIPKDYSYDRSGCVVNSAVINASYSNELKYHGSYYALVALLVVSQVFLLSLFIYPMLRSNAIQNVRKSSRQISKMSETTDSTESNASNKRSSRVFNYIRQASKKLSTSSKGKSNTVQRTIRRSVFCAAISMVSDIIAMASVSLLIPPNVPRSLTNTVYDVSTVVSVLCILATFERYRNILAVFCGGAELSASEKPSNSADDSRKYSGKFQSVSNQNSSSV